jgi:predicted ATP-grasp superfamily ATP-dependent carboligase
MSANNPADRAIVLGTEVNGIAVIRSLGRLGIRCAAIRTPSPGDHTPNSRYLSFTLTLPPMAGDDALLRSLREAYERLGSKACTVVIPTTDRYSEFLSRNSPRLAPGLIACCPDEVTADTFLDKWKTAQVCEKHGILIPRTACPSTPEELEHTAARLSFPVIVKPRYTYGTNFPGKNAIIRTASEIAGFFSEHHLLGSCVIQEIVPSGDGDILVTATYSGKDGRVRAIYSGRKLRQYLPDYGATCFGLSERHRDLEEASIRFLEGIGYTGFAALEFARSRDDGRAYFIELNTRTYYHNQLFADAGVDLTRIAFLDLTGREALSKAVACRQRDGIVWLDFRRDFQSMRIKRRAGQISIGSWLLSLARARSFAVWDWRDPLPFLSACAWRSGQMILNLARRLAR